ncbi:hypothetical protein ABMA28_012596 [Loxostege sticticalis]|uniref:Endonuclease/exonuclease/phosphatase domain-containing protein n=1 Tax=Loxostege sticticalis TaxID=481309 RepID=A0ABD0S4D0_LOXSC
MVIEIFYQNVNRIRSKTKEVYLNILSNNYDIICLTETNLNDSVFDSEFMDSRYNVFRRDRSSTCIKKVDGGGVLVGVKKGINIMRRYDWDSKVEDLWFTLLLSDNKSCKSINVCVCYLPPDLPSELLNIFYDSCSEVILMANPTDEFVLIGDFNTPKVNWSADSGSLSLLPVVVSQDDKTKCLLEFINETNLKQYNGILNQNQRTLDLVLSSFDCGVGVADPISRVDAPHHPPITINFNVPTISKCLDRKRCERLNYVKCNYEDLNNDIKQTNWDDILFNDEIDDDVARFYTKLNELITKHTPFVKERSSSYPPWFSDGLKRCLKEKLKYHKRFKKYKNPRDYDTFALLRTRSKKLMDACYRRYTDSVESSLKNNIKSFWSYVHNNKKNIIGGHSQYYEIRKSTDIG